MAGWAAAAAAAPGACTMLSAADVPGSTTWTAAAVEAVGSVVRERTWYFEASVMMYGLVPSVTGAAWDGSGAPSAASKLCHWLQVAPDRVRIWNWSWAGTAFLGQV